MSNNCQLFAAVCCQDPLVVFIETTADESKEDWIHMVQICTNFQNLTSSTSMPSLTVMLDIIQRANAICDRGVTLDSKLLMQNHISKVDETCFYHVRQFMFDLMLLLNSLVFSRLDYCNAILASLPRSTIAPLQWVQNAAARLFACDHITATLKDRHSLPIEWQIVFKLCVPMHLVHTRWVPSYLRGCVTAPAIVTSRPPILLCDLPAINNTNNHACAWSSENIHFHVPDPEPGTGYCPYCKNLLTLKLSNVN